MEFLTGGRQSGQNLYNALKLYNNINSLPNDTIVRVLKKDGILALCVDKSISKEKVKDKLKKLEIEKEKAKGIKDNLVERYTIENKINILQEILKESEE